MITNILKRHSTKKKKNEVPLTNEIWSTGNRRVTTADFTTTTVKWYVWLSGHDRSASASVSVRAALVKYSFTHVRLYFWIFSSKTPKCVYREENFPFLPLKERGKKERKAIDLDAKIDDFLFFFFFICILFSFVCLANIKPIVL